MGDSSVVARRFGENLRRLRKELGLSHEETGYRASLHRTEIGLLERGERVPRIDTVVRLAGALGVKFECPLLIGLEWKPGSVRHGEFVTQAEHRAEVRRRADEFRARHAGEADPAELAREAREELEERGERS